MTNKLILLDFDDTLICSTELTNYLNLFDEELNNSENYDTFSDNENSNGKLKKDENDSSKNEKLINSKSSTQEYMNNILEQFQQCEIASISFINSLINSFKHEIVIVSNAEMTWITFSLNYFPKLRNFLQDENITIKSSRDDYNHVTDDPLEWKKICFRDIFKSIPPSKQVLCIGDGLHEKLACKYVSNELKMLSNITLKLQDVPSCSLLIKQLKYLSSNMHTIFTTNENYKYKQDYSLINNERGEIQMIVEPLITKYKINIPKLDNYIDEIYSDEDENKFN